MEQIKVEITEAEATKLTLEPGDHLMVRVKGDDHLLSQENVQSLTEALRKRFPDNQVSVFMLPLNAEMDFTVIKQVTQQENSCNNASVCANCNCGKAAALPTKPLRQLTPEETNEEDDE